MRPQTGSSEIAEFIPSLFIILLVVFLPLLNMGFLFLAAAIQYLATNDVAAKASSQPTFASALNTMTSEAYLFQATGLGKFIGLTPQGGFTGCGADLYVLATDIASGTATTSPPDTALSSTVDTKTSMYEISVKSVYSVMPLINLSSVPLLGSVPGLGQPVTLSFTANRPVEHPGGLQAVTASGNTGGTVNPLNRTVTGSVVLPNNAATNAVWRNPTIFDQIQAAGETVVSVNVVTVQSTCPTWTPAGVSVGPGQKIWVDTQAVGQWWTPGLQVRDANGIPGTNYCPGVECPPAPFNSLVGVVGVSGKIQANTPNSFFLGDQQLNMPLGGSGQLYLANNDWNFSAVGDNSNGVQMVRIIVVQ